MKRRAPPAGGVLVLAALVLGGCSPQRDPDVRKQFADATSYSLTTTGILLEVCGWKPASGLRFDVNGLAITYSGDDRTGTGEAHAVFTSGTELRCEGVLRFSYELVESNNRHAAHYHARNFRRIGAPPAILTQVEASATALALGAQTLTAFTTERRFPDRSFWQSYRVELPTAGTYRMVYPPPPKPVVMPVRPAAVLYQQHALIAEGDGTGKLGQWDLAAGPAWLLVTGLTTEAMSFRFEPTQR